MPLKVLNPLNKYLQGKNTDLSTAIAAVDVATDDLRKMRDIRGENFFP